MWWFSVVKAVLARGLFTVHAFVAVWRVVTIKKGDASYWLFAVGIGLLICEGMVSICKRRGREMRWFCPSVFLYLCCIIPPTWVMELDLAAVRKQLRGSSVQNASNTTAIAQQEKLATIPGLQLELNLELSAELWAKVLEQFLLVNLIIGRWLLPKGDLTRSQLSQLLLVYIGMAADIVELFEAFKEDAVVDNDELTFAVLALWSLSLMQFSLVLTATKARKPRLGMDGRDEEEKEEEDDDGAVERQCCYTFRACCFMDTWAIITTILFQDGPFLCLRLLLIFKYNVVSYLNIFFTCKNSLVLLLQLYRMIVLNCETRKETQRPPDSSVESKADSKLYYESSNSLPNCKYEDELGFFGHYDSKFTGQSVAAEYSPTDSEFKHGFGDDFWPVYAKGTKKPRQPPTPKSANSVNVDSGSRDSVVVTFSQSKGSPWTDVCLKLRSDQPPELTSQWPQSLDDVKLRNSHRSESDGMRDTVTTMAPPKDPHEFGARKGFRPRGNNRTGKTNSKTRRKRTRSPCLTSLSVDRQNYRNFNSNTAVAPRSYYMSTRF